MQIYEDKEAVNPILLFSSLRASYPYLVNETKDIIVICEKYNSIIVLTSVVNGYGYVYTQGSIKEYASDVGKSVAELTYLPVALTGLSYKLIR